MRKKRPVNLYLPSIAFPIPAIVSILHRLSGIVLFLCIPLLLWAFKNSTSSPEQFNDLKIFFDAIWIKGFIWLVVVALFGHTLAGIRHLLMDIGVGESLKGGRFSSWMVIILTVFVSILWGVWLW